MLPWGLIIPALLLSALAVAIVLSVAARTIRDVRPWLMVAALGVAVMPLAIIVHNVLSIGGGEEGVSFVVAVTVAPLAIALGLAGGAWVLLHERPALGIPVTLAAAGLALFALLSLLSLVVTTLRGSEVAWLDVTSLVATPLATIAAIVGALWSLAQLALGSGRRASASRS